MPATAGRAAAIAIVKAELAAIRAAFGGFSIADAEWNSRRRKIVAAMAQRLTASTGARITDRSGATKVAIAGLAATSTSGLEGALRNWLAAAERKRTTA
jgi:predicted ABC-type ATPase